MIWSTHRSRRYLWSVISSWKGLDDPDIGFVQIRETLSENFHAGKPKSISYRKEQLLQLAYMIKDNCDRLRDALMEDIGRPALEAQMYVTQSQ